jgi:3-oxoadipate enol-lactonase
MPKMKINGIDLYYEEYGEGQPLLLISGLGQDHTVWYPILEHLKSSFRVILFDNRGVGQTDSPDAPYSTKVMADDIAGLLKGLNVKSAHIVGHSMGGLVAQQLAINYPETVSKLVLYSTYARIGVRAIKFMEFTGKFFELGAIDTALKYIITQLYSDKFLSNEVLVNQTLEIMMKNPHPQTPVGYSRQFEACRLHDTRSQLSLIKIPTLLVAGGRDLFSMQEEVTELQKNISGAQLMLLPCAAHLSHLEMTGDFLDGINRFLAIPKLKYSTSEVKEPVATDNISQPTVSKDLEVKPLCFSGKAPSNVAAVGQKRELEEEKEEVEDSDTGNAIKKSKHNGKRITLC